MQKLLQRINLRMTALQQLKTSLATIGIEIEVLNWNNSIHILNSSQLYFNHVLIHYLKVQFILLDNIIIMELQK